MSVHEVVAAALELSEEDRHALVEQVQDSLYDADEIDPTVLAEARRRLEDMKSGRVAPVPLEEVLDMLDRMAAGDEISVSNQFGRAEIHRRIAEYDAGTVGAVPMEETLTNLRAMLR